jgi:hypothetical protein
MVLAAVTLAADSTVEQGVGSTAAVAADSTAVADTGKKPLQSSKDYKETAGTSNAGRFHFSREK